MLGKQERKSGIDGCNYFSTSLDYCAVAALAGNSPVATKNRECLAGLPPQDIAWLLE
jgi:hypothetical protein